MSSQIPKLTTCLVLQESASQTKPVYHDAVLEKRTIMPLKDGQVLVRMGAVALNHRDVWIRKGQYGSIGFGAVFGADGAGTVVASTDKDDSLLGRRVFLVPMRGWESHPEAPDGSKFGILGGVKWPQLGTFSEYVAVERDHLLLSPDHLGDVDIAAWPLGGVTAWRATFVNGHVEAGQNVLVTGAGGGVALICIQLCIAKGANVFVTSGSEEKIQRAVSVGAKGGVNYKQKDWPTQLGNLLNGKALDVVIDSAGGEIMQQTSKMLKSGGRIVVYGMTADSKIPYRMIQVLKNQKLIGSTMGSHKDLVDATAFLNEKKIIPVVSRVFKGLESAEEAFNMVKNGDQFGKVVIKIEDPAQTKL